jgi:hypothetical protein
VRHPRRRLRTDRLQRDPGRVHAVEQAGVGAEKHGRQRDRELVDQAGVEVLQDRLAAARDADVPVAGDLAGLVDEFSMPSLTKWKVVPPGRSQGSRFSCVTTKTGVWKGASSGHACSPASNMRLPITLAPVRSNVSRAMSVSRPSSPPD